MSTLQENLDAIKLDKDTNLLPENLKAGITCLGVNGTYEGSGGAIKQFATIEEMNNSTGNKEGDLAIVYRSEIQNATADSHFQIATFPDTVVLDTAITDYVDIRYRAVDSSKMFDCMGSLDSSRFRMDCYTESGEIRIEYRSSDGITYTRTDATGNPVDFGTEIYYEMAEMWNDAIGKFIQVGESAFNGIYKYSSSGWLLAPTQLTATADYIYEKEFYGKNGVETGTLTQNASNSFADTNAEMIYKIQNAYNDMEPRILTDSDKAIDKNIYFIPVKKDGTVLLDTSNVTNMSSMFANCKNLTEIPLLNTSNVTSMSGMFSGCTNLTEVQLLNTSKVTNMNNMFNNCTSLTTIPLLNTSNVTMIYGMFAYCNNLTEIPQLDTSNATDMSSMFANCKNLTEIPLLNTSNVTSMYDMFANCNNLTEIPLLNTSKVTNMNNTFRGCTNLSDDSLNNILAMCKNATSYTGTKTLKERGLTSEQATKCQSLSNYSAFTAAGWTTGY